MAKRRPVEETLELIKPHAAQFPIVDGTMCVEVRVPAHLAYVALLQGFVAQMTNHWAYQGSIDDRKAVAELAQQAYVLTDWGSCMNCEELIECITPLLEAQTLQITNNIINQQNFGTTTPGQPMTGEESASNIASGTNPGCDLDVLWSQCLAIVQFTNRAIVDVLEKVEVATNVVELLGLVDEIPVLELVVKQFGSELATQTINYFQEAVLEGYQAQYDTDVENAIACQLFCLCRSDCVVSVDRIFGLFEQRLSSLIPTTPGDFIDLIELVAGIDFDGTEVVDVCFYFAWGAAKLAQFLFGEPVAMTTLQTLLALAVDDASNDWEILCVNCQKCYEWDFSVSEGDWTIDQGEYVDSGVVGFVYSSVVVGSERFVTIQYDFDTPVSLGRIEFTSIHADMFVTVETEEGPIVTNEYHPAPGGLTPEVIGYSTSLPTVSMVKISCRRNVTDGLIWITAAKILYAGATPTGGEEC